MDFSIRAANVDDCKDVARMNLELAEYEKTSEQVTITQRDLEQDGFSKNPFFHCVIAEVPQQHKSHTKIGFALYFYSYSAWRGRAVYMEDLYVMPEFRGKGVGKALMSKVAQLALTRRVDALQLGLAAGCTQLNFTVLHTNRSSVDFYLRRGCSDVTSEMGYHFMSCGGDAMRQLAQP
ncbi:thialysine N-epsilon-acetyltransferase isoform X2 [Dunckerocampus dactyliophorus]|uniref:thialysine N-epsilon-acetyltransferase isoform X2 n=1 Tax=Dunckerocampus dactyliophorus TaxID=161453 RepID=UPI002404F89F|nr:thialysine N-epsilon-acetyltransferase isoform X2 [Dunckerocampus dactyliophorus]